MKMQDIDFLIIGAAKSATTWLQQSLQADPNVLMPDPELHYFSREYHRGDAWYLAQFGAKAVGQLAGEKSNSYLDTQGAGARVHKSLPHIKLVAQLRNPVERAYSDYCMLYRRGEVGRNIASYLDPRAAAGGRFLAGGKYSQQLEVYLELYGRDRLLVLSFENVKADPIGQLAELRAFLGLDGAGAAVHATREKVKDKTVPMVSPELRRYFGWVKPLVAPVRKTEAFGRLRSMVAREIQYPALTPDLRERMSEHFAGEVESVQRLIGKNLPGW
ncbi:MAG: sulfotransferase family protein [Aestuariivirga sp.]